MYMEIQYDSGLHNDNLVVKSLIWQPQIDREVFH